MSSLDMETENLLPSPEPDNHGMLWQVPGLSLQGLEEGGPLQQALQSSLQLVQLGRKREGKLLKGMTLFTGLSLFTALPVCSLVKTLCLVSFNMKI